MAVRLWVATSKPLDEPDFEWVMSYFPEDQYKIDTDTPPEHPEGRYIQCGGSRLYLDLEPKGPWSSMPPEWVETMRAKLPRKGLRRTELGSRIACDFVTRAVLEGVPRESIMDSLLEDEQVMLQRLVEVARQCIELKWPAVVGLVHRDGGFKCWDPYRDV